MTVVVFGAAGFIGRNLIRTLREKGVGLVGSDIVNSPYGTDIDYEKGDLLDFEKINKIVRSEDYVVHLAASPLQNSLSDPRSNMLVNIHGTLNILDAARMHGIKKIIFASASSVVGTVKYNPVDEEHPCIPRTPYAVAKKACEDYIRVYGELYGLNFIVFRLFNVYGPWQLSSSGAVIPKIYDNIKTGKPIDIFGDGNATRDFVYVEDVAEFLHKAMFSKITNEIVNLGTGSGTSVLELVRLSANIMGIQPKLAFKPERSGEIDNFVADISKLTKLFNSRPATSLEEGLKKTFGWLAHVS